MNMLTLAAALLAAVAPGGPAMNQVARGRFDVQLTPAPADGPVARMTLGKTFHGDLEGTSRGVMLSMGNPAAGSAGYVAMEEVTGTLAGHRGSFALQHSGLMAAGAMTLEIKVVPGSGTGALTGLRGTMDIDMSGGDHRYTFSYSLGN